MTKNVDWDLYKWWLGQEKENERANTINEVVDGLLSNIKNNPAYQEDATRNGETQAILATRKSTRKCKITVVPGDMMCIGDLVGVFGEHWLCMELYTDEYGLTYGELWMCNHIFKFQNGTPHVISKYGIVDDGSYSKAGDKPVIITDSKYTCYISHDQESEGLYVDKRLAIETVLDSSGNEMLETGKITWIDITSKNYGQGSHLMTFRLDNDVFNKERDNLQEMVCDFISTQETIPETPDNSKGYISIEGKSSMRVGTGRTYTAFAVNADGTKNSNYTDFQWSMLNQPNGVELQPKGNQCLLRLPLEDSLIGVTLEIICKDRQSIYESNKKEVAVITIG